MEYLTGVQIIARAINNPKFPITFDEHHEERCAMCGGHMTDKVFPIVFSSCWRTTYEFEHKDGSHFCAACAMMTTGSNRNFFLTTAKTPYHIFNMHGHLHLTYQEFYDYLKAGKIEYPCVIARCNNINRTKKNVSWKLSRGISYSDQDLIIHELGSSLYLPVSLKDKDGEGTVRCSRATFLYNVEQFRKIISKVNTDEMFQNMNPAYAYVMTWKALNHVLVKQNRFTTENLEASFLALSLAHQDDKQKTKKKGRKAS